jgi:integrase/recombinase XerD
MKQIAIIQNHTEKALSFLEGLSDNYFFARRDFIRRVRESGQPFNIETIRAYFKELNESKMAASKIRVKRAAIKTGLKKLSFNQPIESYIKMERALDRLDRDPETKAPKINQAGIDEEKIITEKAFHILLKGSRSERQRLFLRFLWGTGARISETLGILKENVQKSGKGFKIKAMGKGKKERILIVPETLIEDIRRTCNVDDSSYLFHTSTGKCYSRCYVSNQIKKLGRDILGRRISAHVLRHSFASLQIKKTHKIKAVSSYLGHHSTSITLDMYTHESLSRKELFAIFSA